MVEHSAVNRVVVGSSPTRGVSCEGRVLRSERALEKAWSQGKEPGKEKRLRGQAVKTSPFHGGNTGSIPVGVIFRLCSAYNIINILPMRVIFTLPRKAC